MSADSSQEETAMGFRIEEGLILCGRKLEVAIDIADT